MIQSLLLSRVKCFQLLGYAPRDRMLGQAYLFWCEHQGAKTNREAYSSKKVSFSHTEVCRTAVQDRAEPRQAFFSCLVFSSDILPNPKTRAWMCWAVCCPGPNVCALTWRLRVTLWCEERGVFLTKHLEMSKWARDMVPVSPQSTLDTWFSSGRTSCQHGPVGGSFCRGSLAPLNHSYSPALTLASDSEFIIPIPTPFCLAFWSYLFISGETMAVFHRWLQWNAKQAGPGPAGTCRMWSWFVRSYVTNIKYHHMELKSSPGVYH